jgi:hypothetical protein
MFLSLVVAASTIAIVAQDQVVLRSAPKDSAAQQTLLWQGDSLEIRGEKMDYLQVYDHRRERAGYVKASQLRLVRLDADALPEIKAVLRFVKERPGSEALGISYVAAYMKAAAAADMNSGTTAEVFDTLGTLAERLAKRAGMKNSESNKNLLAAHLEVAAYYGVQIKSYDYDGTVQLCYEGDAFRRVLSLPATAEQSARATLALTRHDCVDPALPAIQKASYEQWRAEILDKLNTQALPEYLKNRVRMRKAGVWASISYYNARKNSNAPATLEAAQRSINELAAVNKEELPDEDQATYADAAVRVGATRWAAEPTIAIKNDLYVKTQAGEPGQTCVSLIDARPYSKSKNKGQELELVKKCTYSVVWIASARVNANQSQLVLAVSPLPTWRETWIFHQVNQEWIIDVVPPANTNPELAYVEFAGWVPSTNKILLAREAKKEGRYQRSFEVFNLERLQVENFADKPSSLNLFHKWQDALWKKQTISLR